MNDERQRLGEQAVNALIKTAYGVFGERLLEVRELWRDVNPDSVTIHLALVLEPHDFELDGFLIASQVPALEPQIELIPRVLSRQELVDPEQAPHPFIAKKAAVGRVLWRSL